MSNVLKKLDDWVNASKGRSTQISCGDGYDSSSWEIMLYIREFTVTVVESTGPSFNTFGPNSEFYYVNCDDIENVLEYIINQALEIAENYENKSRK